MSRLQDCRGEGRGEERRGVGGQGGKWRNRSGRVCQLNRVESSRVCYHRDTSLVPVLVLTEDMIR